MSAPGASASAPAPSLPTPPRPTRVCLTQDESVHPDPPCPRLQTRVAAEVEVVVVVMVPARLTYRKSAQAKKITEEQTVLHVCRRAHTSTETLSGSDTGNAHASLPAVLLAARSLCAYSPVRNPVRCSSACATLSPLLLCV